MEVVTVPSDEVAALKLTIEGMRAKLNEAKRSKAKYQDGVRYLEMQASLMARIQRENRRLRIAISEIALSRAGTSSVRSLAKYAQKVLTGLGYSADDAQQFVSRLF